MNIKYSLSSLYSKFQKFGINSKLELLSHRFIVDKSQKFITYSEEMRQICHTLQKGIL